MSGNKTCTENRLAPTTATQATSSLEHCPPDQAYSAFSLQQRRWIAVAACTSAMFSGLSSFIYYPAITALSRALSVSLGLINLSITAYQIVSGIAPSIMGDMADQTGRRPVTLIAFTVYFVANLGLALQSSYPALIVLRCLQSARASSTIAIAYGFIADIAPPADRGSYVGMLQGFTNSAPCLGPILGGVLTQTESWRWVFWFLSIVSGTHLLSLLMFLPETSRKIVGDGNLPPSRLMNKSLYSLLVARRSSRTTSPLAKSKLHMPNPLTCLTALLQRNTLIVLIVGGLQYTIYGCLAASLSAQMIRIYSLNYLEGGLLYIPSGVGGISAALSTGKLLDRDFRRVARSQGLEEASSRKDLNDLSDFPIERARLSSVFILLAVSTIGTLGYGWSLSVHTHMAVPLIMQFCTGFSQVALFTVCGTLLTDLNPDRSATVQVSYNLVRCGLSAGGLAALQAMIDEVGLGWCFTIFAVIGAGCVPFFAILRSYGWYWRREAIVAGSLNSEKGCSRLHQ